MGLRLRLFLLVILPITLVVGAYGMLRIRQETREVVEAERRHAGLTARAIQIAIEHAMRDRRPSDISRLASKLVATHPQVQRIRLFDRDLKTLAAEPEGSGFPNLPDALREVIITGEGRQFFEAADTIGFLLPVRGKKASLPGAVEVVFSTTKVEENLAQTTRDVAFRLSGLAVILTVLTALAIRWQVLRPLARLTASIREFGEGRPRPPLALRRRDELGAVAAAFDRMAAQLGAARLRVVQQSEHALELEQQLRRAQILTVAGRLAAALAHEVGTPLNIVSGRAEMLLRTLGPDHRGRQDLEAIVSQIDRIAGVIRSMLDSVRAQKPEIQRVGLEALLAQLLPLIEFDARRRGIALATDLPEGLPAVGADPGQLQQVLLNLFVNALEATPAGGRVAVSARPSRQDGRSGLIIEVSDTGPGIPPEALGRIFDPFFTTKPPGQGTGLGLAICRDIMRDHGGILTVHSRKGLGTTFSAWLPEPDKVS